MLENDKDYSKTGVTVMWVCALFMIGVLGVYLLRGGQLETSSGKSLALSAVALVVIALICTCVYISDQKWLKECDEYRKVDLRVKLMCGNTIIADVIAHETWGHAVSLKLREGISTEKIPQDLFKDDKTSVHFWEFQEWGEQRCDIPDKLGKRKKIKQLGLKRYNQWEIVKKTGGHVALDQFWIAVLD